MMAMALVGMKVMTQVLEYLINAQKDEDGQWGPVKNLIHYNQTS